jgi:hypothetical protein
VFKTTPEIWSFSFKLDTAVPLEPDVGPEFLDPTLVKAALTTFFATGMFGAAVECTGWRGYKIGPDGKTIGNPTIVEYGVGQTVVGNGVSSKPPQCTLVLTTVAANRGHARFGRMYLPTLAVPIGNDLRMSVTDQTTFLGQCTTFLKDISDSLDVPNTITGVNAVNVSSVGDGTKQVIDHCQLGRVVDTHRTRRNALVEDYMASGHIDW